jgi:WXG100 family type VII secretion target
MCVMERYLKVDSDQMDELARRMDAAVDEIESILDRLEARVQGLRGEWAGEAAVAYEIAHRDWDSSARELQRVAREVARVTRTGSSRFRATERSNAAVWPA